MKKLLFTVLVTVLFAACKKESSPIPDSEETIAAVAASKSGKIDVCHYDAKTRSSHMINISANAWPAHKAHGDVMGACAGPIATVAICDQVWMLKNLDVSTYRNGDPIPEVTDYAEWDNLTTGAWCYNNNDPANGTTYGKLYNWFAVNDPRGLAPAGWHVPSDGEWYQLYTCIDAMPPAGNIGGKMKEPGTSHWLSPNNDATNSSGFTALPGGQRASYGAFDLPGSIGTWWSSTADFTNDAYIRTLIWWDGFPYSGSSNKHQGFSVRCVKD